MANKTDFKFFCTIIDDLLLIDLETAGPWKLDTQRLVINYFIATNRLTNFDRNSTDTIKIICAFVYFLFKEL